MFGVVDSNSEMNTEKLFNHLVSFDLEAQEFVALCPPEFRLQNPWSQFAEKVYDGFDQDAGPDTSVWIWIAETEKEKIEKVSRFYRLLSSFLIHRTDKIALAGFMLSLILQETPLYISKIYIP
jgi:hypothetical protein